MKKFPRTGARGAFRVAIIGLAASLVIAVAGCGSSNSSDSTVATESESSATTGSSTTASEGASLGLQAPAKLNDLFAMEPTPEQSKEAEAAGEKAAEAAGDPVAVPTDKTIAYIALSGQTDSSKRQLGALESAAGLFGFKVITCDPNFEPQKIKQCATSIAAQQPDLVLSAADEPGLLGSGLRDVADAGVPWVNISGPVTPSKYMVQYAPDYSKLTKTYDDWLFNAIEERGQEVKLLSIGAESVGLAARQAQEQLDADVEAAGASFTVDHQLDLANAPQDTLSTTKTGLQQHPDTTGTWTSCDFCVPLMAQSADALGLSGDKRPIIGGEFATQQGIAGLREGSIDGLVDVAFEAEPWVALDQALEHWARDREMAPDDSVFDSYGPPLQDPYMLTKENAGTTGPGPILGPDFVTLFVTKWNQEFTK